MAKEVHLYMAGNDPFMLALGGTTFFIHAGLPEQGAPPPAAETPASGGLVKQTPLGGVYGSYIVAPDDAEEVRALIEDQADPDTVEFGLAVDRSSSRSGSGRQLTSILEGVDRSVASDVKVHLLPLDSDVADG
jgi:hypothetical protein